MVIHTGNPRTAGTGGSQVFMTSQSSWIGELLVWWGTLPQKVRWREAEEDSWCWHVAPICILTHIHAHRTTYICFQKPNNSNSRNYSSVVKQIEHIYILGFPFHTGRIRHCFYTSEYLGVWYFSPCDFSLVPKAFHILAFICLMTAPGTYYWELC